MKRILLPLLVLVALGLLGTLLWFQMGRKHSDADQSSRSTSSANETATKLDAQSESLSALESGARPERANVSANASNAALSGNVVEGEVRAPEDCIVDTDVEVFALARPSDLDTFMMQTGPRRADGPTAGDVDPKFVVARAKLDANGRFALALPKDATRAHLLCAGRAWLLRETITVDVSKKTFVALQAECGGWIEARVNLPAGSSSTSAIDGEVAQLSMSMTNVTGGPGRMGAMFRRNERRAVVKDGRFELRALDPDQAYTLDLASNAFADASAEVALVARGTATPVALQLERGGVVHGRVLDAAGKPVAGAVVEATKSRGPFGMGERSVRKGTTGSDGAYELAAVAPGSVQVGARAPEFPASESKQVDVVDQSAANGIDFTLGAGEMISGVVRWKDGTPAVGAEVSANGDRGQNFDPRQFRMQGRRADDAKFVTDKDGRFVVKGLAAGKFTLAAEALKPEDAAKIDPKDAEAKRRSLWRARASGVETGKTDATLTLDPPLIVHGIVTGADGKPVTAFRVQASGGGGGQGGRRGGGDGGGMAFAFGAAARQSQDVTNERGEFIYTFQREGSYKLTVSAEGYVTSDGIDLEVPIVAFDAPLAITLQRGAIVQGVVRSPLGKPVANATVSNAGANSPAAMFGGRMPGAPDDGIKARTDAEGRFTLSELKAGRLLLVAESLSWSRSEELGLDLQAGQTIADAVLTLRQGGSIVGEAYEDGRPASERSIMATEMKTFVSASARTDGAGRFRLEHLVPGSWRVMAMPAANEIGALGQNGRGGGGDGGMGAMFSKMKSATADVAEGQEVRIVIGAPPEAPVAVHGKVTQGGAPVAGVRVTFMGSGDSFGPGMKTSTSGADGAYAIQLDKPGDYSITVQQNGGRASMLEFVETVKPGADATVDLALPTARISGRVRTPEGDPARGIRVSLFPAAMGVGGSMMGGGFSEITTDDDGNFDVNTLRAGTYSLIVGGSGIGGFRGPGGGGAGDSKYGRKVVSDIQLAESEWRKDLDVRLENAAGVDVEVVDDHGAPVNGAAVFARDESGRAVDRMSSVRTDVNGKARYGGLAPGAYTFSARKDSLSSGESTKTDVRSGGSSSVKITLAQGTLLYVTTVDADGQPLRARVSVKDEAGHDVAGLMSAADLMERMNRAGPGTNEQKIGPLAPGTYKVKATANDGKTTEKSVTLTGQSERKMTLTVGG